VSKYGTASRPAVSLLPTMRERIKVLKLKSVIQVKYIKFREHFANAS
jgi:hypothetical protein